MLKESSSQGNILNNNGKIKVLSWGFGKYGQIGSIDYHYSITPIELNLEKEEEKNKDSVIQSSNNTNGTFHQNQINPNTIKCGEFHTAIIDDKNILYLYGKNTYGQLGTGDTFISSFPRKAFFKENTKITQVACGGEHTIALSSKNELFSWGLNVFGQLGLSSNKNVNVPTKIVMFRQFQFSDKNEEIMEEKFSNILDKVTITEIAAGAQHSLILTSDNNLYSCGSNKWGDSKR